MWKCGLFCQLSVSAIHFDSTQKFRTRQMVPTWHQSSSLWLISTLITGGQTRGKQTKSIPSFFFKPEELPGALSQNRGLERETLPLPRDELILLQVKTLQTKAEDLPSEKHHRFLRVAHPNEPCKQNMGDNFSSLVFDSRCISMKCLQKSKRSCEAARFPSGISGKVQLISSFFSCNQMLLIF